MSGHLIKFHANILTPLGTVQSSGDGRSHKMSPVNKLNVSLQNIKPAAVMALAECWFIMRFRTITQIGPDMDGICMHMLSILNSV